MSTQPRNVPGHWLFGSSNTGAGTCALLLALTCGFWLAAEEKLAAQDVAEIDLYKRSWYSQTDDSGPVLLPIAQYPYDLDATVFLTTELLNDQDALDWISGMTLRTPQGSTKVMEFDASYGFSFTDQAVSAASLNSRYGVGTYRFTLTSLITGQQNYNTSLGGDAYPPAPRILDFATTQNINPYRDFVLRWTSFSGTGDKYAIVQAWDIDTFSTVYYDGPFGAAQTSVTIPAFTFEPNRTYGAVVILQRDTYSSPATTPQLFSGFEAYTLFTMHTTDGSALEPSKFVGATIRPNGDLELAVQCTPGRNLVVQGTTAIGGAWGELSRSVPQVSSETVVIQAASLGNRQILRAYQE